MPKRTNERQQIISMLRTLLAGPDTTVTESREFWDSGAKIKREVDVVAELSIDGETFIASYEVTNMKNPVDVQWVEQHIGKHERLPTDRLYLVPWGGATPAARALVEENPWVTLIAPEIVAGVEGPIVQNLFADFTFLEPKQVVATVERTNGDDVNVIVAYDYAIYSKAGEEIESAGEHCNRILNDPDIIQKVLRTAHDHPERDELKSFTIGAIYGGDECYLHHSDDVGDAIEFQRIKAIEITGTFMFTQSPLALELRTFAKKHFAHGRADFGEVTALAVATMNEDEAIEQIRVRFNRVAPKTTNDDKPANDAPNTD